jgi:hypothetical protein
VEEARHRYEEYVVDDAHDEATQRQRSDERSRPRNQCLLFLRSLSVQRRGTKDVVDAQVDGSGIA